MGKVTHVYVKDPESAWVPAVLERSEGDKAYVTVPTYKDEQSMTSDNGRAAKGKTEQVVNLKDYHHKVLPLANVDANGNLLEFPDMVQLPYLHEVSRCVNPKATRLDVTRNTPNRPVFSRDSLLICFA
jgi:hypothetical protein